jgi:hypothetical protein
MTPELTAFHDRATAAERVGDVDEALAYHRGIPMFGRSRHGRLLEQLAAVKADLTPWAWARWIAYLAIRGEEPGSWTGRQLRPALLDSVELFHADLIDAAYDEGDDPVRVAARVMGESWAHHQLALHDYGAMATFLDEFVGGELAVHAPLARSWVGMPMGGYRIERRTSPYALVVRDLADDRVTEVLDLGAGCLAGPNAAVIGRLVPSGTTPASMFDTAPLPLDERLAREVARVSSRGDWADVLAVAIEAGRLDPADLLREDYELVSDIPSLDLLTFGTRPTDLARVMDQRRDGRDEVGRAAFRILRQASEGALDDAAAPYVAAAALNVHAREHAQRRVLAPGQRARWLHWAELVPAPGRARLLAFAEAPVDVA